MITKKTPLLEIKDLWVKTDKKIILKGVNLKITEGESHVIFGPNGSGKSTLLETIAGLPHLKVIKGTIQFKGQSIVNIPIHKRFHLGIGLGFQQPPAINGIKLQELLKIMKASKKEIQSTAKKLKLEKLLERDINKDFSGGEMKLCEILQLSLQKPDLILLDEPDSGIDLENLRLLSNAVNKLLQKSTPILKRNKSALVITHSGNLLDYINLDIGHVMIAGKLTPNANPHDIWEQTKKCNYENCRKCILNTKNEKTK